MPSTLKLSTRSSLLPTLAILLPLAFGPMTALTAQEAQDTAAWTKAELNRLLETYIAFHKNPELSFQERETAARFASELRASGCEVTENVGGFGVVGVLRNGEGPLVLVRSDLDALPVTEQTGLPFASTKTMTEQDGSTVGVMHACGHDVHMTNLLGVAGFLGSHREQWQGTILFIGQPAEERGAGARAMLDDKLFERFGKPDYALAMHVSPNLSSQQVGILPGYTMANVDSIDIEITGKGGHGAIPQNTIDPIVIAARLVLDLQTIVSREIKPIDPAVLTIGSIHAGTKHNIIPDTCRLQLTVRSFSDSVRQQILDSIRRKANAAAASSGAPEPQIKISEGTPSLYNDPQLTEKVRGVLERTLGSEQVATIEPAMIGEDFSRFGREGIPAVMFELGVVEPRKLAYYREQHIAPPSLHTAGFAPDVERALPTGIQAMTAVILDLTAKKPSSAK
ncbi:MAG: amidohydrolase [Planctomycetota bacterium]|jgi:amidohydrolase